MFCFQFSSFKRVRLLFYSDTPQTNDNVAKTPRSKTSSRFPRLGRSRNQEARPEPQSGDL